MRFLLVASLLSAILPATGQVTQDNIANRINLSPDGEAISSTTAGSSVQWDCVNKRLTEKCLVYHNDQWYSFTVPQDGRYFINLSNQECLSHRGIQLLLIEGDPCVTESYRLIHCVPKLPLSDVYVALDSLVAGTPYLLNIDGFLGDFCSFDNQVGERAKGTPLVQRRDSSITGNLTLEDSIHSYIMEDKRFIR